MKKTLTRVACLAAAFLWGLTGCAGGPVPMTAGDHTAVGRIEVHASPKGWRVIPLQDHKMHITVYNGDTIGDSTPIKRAALILDGPAGRMEALLVFESAPGFGQVVADGQCRAQGSGMYVSDLSGGSHTVPACVRAWARVSPEEVSKDGLPPDVVAAAQATPDRLPKSSAFVLVRAMNSNGAQTVVTAVVNPALIGHMDGEPLAPIPNGNEVGRAVAIWADQLGQTAVRSLSSFHNDLVVPPLRRPGSEAGQERAGASPSSQTVSLSTERGYRASLERWVGRPVAELVAVWGEPTRIYDKWESVTGKTYVWERSDGEITVNGMLIPASCYTTFILDVDGRLGRPNFNGNSCKAVDPSASAGDGATFTLRSSGFVRDATTVEQFDAVEFIGAAVLPSQCGPITKPGGVPAHCVGEDLPAMPMRVRLRGYLQTDTPAQREALIRKKAFPSVEGVVDFNPAPEGIYVVRGGLTPTGSSVWIEDFVKKAPATKVVRSNKAE